MTDITTSPTVPASETSTVHIDLPSEAVTDVDITAALVHGDRVFGIARRHLGSGVMATSAAIAYSDGVACFHRAVVESAPDLLVYGRLRALDSIAFSVGILHVDYAIAQALAKSDRAVLSR